MNSNRAANPMSGPSRWVTDRQPPRLRELHLNSLPYVPLPRAPLRWATPSARAQQQMQEAEALLRDSRCAMATGIDREVSCTRAIQPFVCSIRSTPACSRTRAGYRSIIRDARKLRDCVMERVGFELTGDFVADQ
jgi:hypothetical protein